MSKSAGPPRSAVAGISTEPFIIQVPTGGGDQSKVRPAALCIFYLSDAAHDRPGAAPYDELRPDPDGALRRSRLV